ncbi:MAG: hypothetical protein Q4F88_07230 [Eubacteriales bacterium]|nr:hypothetical protein [Eubacteriales bacterium]
MENEELKKYIIDFVEETLNNCECFTSIYGKDFVRMKLETNIDKVYTIYNDTNGGLYNIENSCMTIFSKEDSNKTLTIPDIENNKQLHGMILHESIHAIFKRTKEERETFGISDGTGVHEFYKNGQELGRGLNEGLTEWICKKAGYGRGGYLAEQGIINILELAIGESAVMQFAKGDIKGNISQLLQMDTMECLQTIARVDMIYHEENESSPIQKNIFDNENDELDRNITILEANLFEKYFKSEIEMAQNSENISEEMIERFFNLNFCINGGKTQASSIYNSRLPFKFTTEIYPELLKKRQAVLMSERRNNRNFGKIDEQQIQKKQKLMFTQKVAQFIQKNSTLMKIPFLEKYVGRQLNVLPSAHEEMTTVNSGNARQSFLNSLTNLGDCKNTSPVQRTSRTDQIAEKRKKMEEKQRFKEDNER